MPTGMMSLKLGLPRKAYDCMESAWNVLSSKAFKLNATGRKGEDAAEENRLPESSPFRDVGFWKDPTCRKLPYFALANTVRNWF